MESGDIGKDGEDVVNHVMEEPNLGSGSVTDPLLLIMEILAMDSLQRHNNVMSNLVQVLESILHLYFISNKIGPNL